jgi:hypothetical protein
MKTLLWWLTKVDIRGNAKFAIPRAPKVESSGNNHWTNDQLLAIHLKMLKPPTNHLDQYQNSNAAAELRGPHTIANWRALRDLTLSLPQVLDLLDCPKVREQELQLLGKTAQERSHWEALLNLWQSLGRPESGFWPEIRVRYNRIAFSCDVGMP